jgi:outer membrane protein TolC
MISRTAAKYISVSFLLALAIPAADAQERPHVALPPLAWYRNIDIPPLTKESPKDLNRDMNALVHDGEIYLSLQDALTLAIANNLDAEIRRYDLSIADMDVLRTKGSGVSRGISYLVSQMPAGMGGPGTPLLNSAATNVNPTAPIINSTFFDVNQIVEPQTNLSIQGPASLSPGPPIPAYDPTLSGDLSAIRRDPLDFPGSGSTGSTGNLSALQGFSTGLSLQGGLTSTGTSSLNVGTPNTTSPPSVFSRPNLFFALRQPLLRGFGASINRRYIVVAQNNTQASRLLFKQQLIELVYGITRLYYDLVSLIEDVTVKRDTLAAAQRLYNDDAMQVDAGTLAPIELTRAQALVSSSELDLVRAQGLAEQQEIILKTQLSRNGLADPVLQANRIHPTEKIVVPASDSLKTASDLVSEAIRNRPDLQQADIQLQNSEELVKGSRNAVLPEIDLTANAQSRGIVTLTPQAFSAATLAGLAPITTSVSSVPGLPSRIYEAGIELQIPFRNRVALADAARDTLQLRQSEARRQQLANQIQEEVENAMRAVHIAHSAYNAAVQSRIYQEQLLQAERERLSVGASANFFVVQDQAYVAQARSTEVASRSAYIKARFALERSLGTILESNHIDVDDAIRNLQR